MARFTHPCTYPKTPVADALSRTAADETSIASSRVTLTLPRQRRSLMGPSDVVTVTRIDRLARSTFDLFGIIKRIADPRRISGRWRNRGPIPAPAQGA
jgi:hypothetical protein